MDLLYTEGDFLSGYWTRDGKLHTPPRRKILALNWLSSFESKFSESM